MSNPHIHSAGFWEGKHVFVTGAGGFIGSHLVEALVEKGAQVQALVRYNSTNNWGWLDTLPEEVMESVKVFSGDIRDGDFVRTFQQGCDVGFHLAALIAIPYSYHAPRSYVETNVLGTTNVLQACRDSGIERVICTSTSEVYGTAQYVPINEEHPLQGQSPYSATKIAADHMAESFYRSFNLPVSIVRPFNTYGPRQSMRAFIPNVIRQALAGESIRVGNLRPTRDFNYVSDTVRGFLLAGASRHSEGEIINIGTGQEISMGDVITKVEDLLGKKLEVIQEIQRVRPEKSEVFRLCASIAKAQHILGYEPMVSLDEGLKETISWCQQQSPSTKTALYHV